MADLYPIRPVTVDEVGALAAVGEQAFNSTYPPAEALEHELITFEAERSLAAFDGDRVVGTAAAFTFQMTVPGGTTGVAGVSWVSVLPSHRRRGILSALMRRQLADISDRGEPVAALYCSEASIYGRYGYGMATQDVQLTVRQGEGQMLRPEAVAAAAGRIRLRLVKPTEPRAELSKVYDAFAQSRPGMMARDERWWESLLADPEWARHGKGPLRCLIAEDDAGACGYALYAAKPSWDDDGIPTGVLTVQELMAADPATSAALWADLLTRDLVGQVEAPQRPADEPLLHLLADRRRARPRLADGLWIRLIDLPAALSRRRYACPVDLVIEVTDELMPANSGRWRLRAGGLSDPAPPACERATAAADISLPVQALGAAYLGGTPIGALAGAGLAAELRPGAAAALSAAMSWHQAPWNPAVF
jgi:predicted acetyltransferase